MKLATAARIAAQLAAAVAQALDEGKDELAADTFSAETHAAIDALKQAVASAEQGK